MPVKTLLRPCRALARFLPARGGNVAVTFALASVPMLALSGAAIDYGLATRQQARLQASADATALILCQTPLSTTNAQLQTQAGTLMAGYVPDPTLVVDALNVVPGTQTTARTITLTTHVGSTTFFGGFTGVKKPTEVGVSQCATPVPKSFEIALVLDNTGSMANSSNGQSKIQALRTAATNFIEYVYRTTAFSDQTKISVVPFAGAVTVKDPRIAADYTSTNTNWIDWTGRSAYHWKNINQAQAAASGLSSRDAIFKRLATLNTTGSYTISPYAYYDWGWGGCIETPPYPQNVQDVAPDVNNPDSLYQQYFAPDEPGSGNANQGGYFGNQYNNTGNYVWNDYIADSNCQTPQSMDYRSAESRGCKYAAATTFASRNNTMLGAIDLGQNGPNWGCTSAPMQRLLTLRSGNNKATLENLIGSMAARGSTNIHEGFMWGWRSLSPNGVFSADTAPYNTATTAPAKAVTKIIILMTDGMDDWLNFLGNSASTGNGALYNALGYPTNSNTADAAGTSANARLQPKDQPPTIENGYSNIYDSSPKSGRTAIDDLFAEACTNAKVSPNPGDPAKVSVYTIAFSIPGDAIDQRGQNLLQACASSPGQYFLANDSNALIAAFGKIASSIGALRISQ